MAPRRRRRSAWHHGDDGDGDRCGARRLRAWPRRDNGTLGGESSDGSDGSDGGESSDGSESSDDGGESDSGESDSGESGDDSDSDSGDGDGDGDGDGEGDSGDGDGDSGVGGARGTAAVKAAHVAHGETAAAARRRPGSVWRRGY
ncbi:hypothetical protein [Dactylosporangium sp. NPDC049140]|uniref:hypothetical protein n=1 Tax=Dactylosporangium sp. NPDC049140 TaxID=3155647 RepID=UPI00340B91B7